MRAVPHGLRHTAATLMLAEGWDVKVLAQLLGHTTVNTTSKYLHELPGELSVAVNAHPLTPARAWFRGYVRPGGTGTASGPERGLYPA